MLRNVLSMEGCQIVRLGLIGNAIGDAGVSTMGESLQVRTVDGDGGVVLIIYPCCCCALVS